jgi:hypothetical protein
MNNYGVDSIEWHKDCLFNRKQSEERKRQLILADIRSLNELMKENTFLDFQIKCAESEKKKKFTDRYKRKLYETKFIKAPAYKLGLKSEEEKEDE